MFGFFLIRRNHHGVSQREIILSSSGIAEDLLQPKKKNLTLNRLVGGKPAVDVRPPPHATWQSNLAQNTNFNILCFKPLYPVCECSK